MISPVTYPVVIHSTSGYRDAQVGWIEVKEDRHSMHPGAPHQPEPTPRRALFLVIYAPRRGILEVWAAQQGSRVAAFNVSKVSHRLNEVMTLDLTHQPVASKHPQFMKNLLKQHTILLLLNNCMAPLYAPFLAR